MKVAWVNPNPPIELRHYICDVCKKDFIWNDDCGYHEKFIGSGYSAYEKQFFICSEDCRKVAEEKKMIEAFYKSKK